MASREERMQQRLRGAQRRQVKDVDFDLVFPAAAPAPASETSASQKSPQPELPQSEPLPQLSSRRTPARHPQPSNVAIPKENVRPPGLHSTIDANMSAKRRKLDSDDTPASSARSTRSQRLPRRDIYTLEDDRESETALDMLLDTTNDTVPREAISTSIIDEAPITSNPATRLRAKTPTLPAQLVDEVTESPVHAPGSGHRIRASGIDVTASSSQLQSMQEDSSIQAVSETPVRQTKRKRGEPLPRPSPRKARRSHQHQILEGDSLELDELSPEQPFRHAPASKSQEETEMLDDEPVPEERSIQAPEETEEAEAIDDEHAAAILTKNNRRRISRGAVPIAPPEVDSPVSSLVAKKRRGRQRIGSTPVRQRHPKQAPPKTKSGKTGKSVRIGSPIPVKVYRLTKPIPYDDDEMDADILNSEIPLAKRSGVNTIDVLSEIAQEIFETTMQTLEEGGQACEDAAQRREYKTKWQAVVDFGKELQTRLLEHTINLDNGYSLERRHRVEQKKKLHLRGEILRIRAEREQIALRMDDVRINHEKEKAKAEGWSILNSNVHDIEMAVDLGKQQQDLYADPSTEMIGTEVLLKRLAGEVSNKGDSGGLLRQIKEFNAFLERAALALESKKV